MDFVNDIIRNEISRTKDGFGLFEINKGPITNVRALATVESWIWSEDKYTAKSTLMLLR